MAEGDSAKSWRLIECIQSAASRAMLIPCLRQLEAHLRTSEESVWSFVDILGVRPVVTALRRSLDSDEVKYYALAILARVMQVTNMGRKLFADDEDETLLNVILDGAVAAMLSPGTSPLTMQTGLSILSAGVRVRPRLFDAMQLAMSNHDVIGEYKRRAIHALSLLAARGGFDAVMQMVHANLVTRIANKVYEYPVECISALVKMTEQDPAETSEDGALAALIVDKHVLDELWGIMKRRIALSDTIQLLKYLVKHGQIPAVLYSGCVDVALNVDDAILSARDVEALLDICTTIVNRGYVKKRSISLKVRVLLARLATEEDMPASPRARHFISRVLRDALQLFGEDSIEMSRAVGLRVLAVHDARPPREDGDPENQPLDERTARREWQPVGMLPASARAGGGRPRRTRRTRRSRPSRARSRSRARTRSRPRRWSRASSRYRSRKRR
jgi:hypothetical protein